MPCIHLQGLSRAGGRDTGKTSGHTLKMRGVCRPANDPGASARAPATAASAIKTAAMAATAKAMEKEAAMIAAATTGVAANTSAASLLLRGLCIH